ncbi:MAG: HAD family hydrolase [Bacteroidales bacterium]|nr:HAD family hydrolase [Bacteroidales bacterium]
MLNTVVFDLDGTLLDTLGDLAGSVNYALRKHGLRECSLQEVRSFLGNGIVRLMQNAVKNAVEGVAFEEVFQTFRSHYLEHCLDTTQPYPGILPMMEKLRESGVKIAIVSNKLHPAVQELNRRFFADLVTSAVGESETVRRKPHPDGVLKALEELGSRPEEAVYVGDSEVDWETARQAGLRCVLVLWGFRDEDFLRGLPGVQAYLKSPDELLRVVTEE